MALVVQSGDSSQPSAAGAGAGRRHGGRLPNVDDRHFSLVAELLADGEVIPFLGAGANLSDRPDEATWEPGRFPPSGSELALTLAERSRYPDSDDPDLLRVSQYVDAILGEGQLYRYLHTVFDSDYPPSSVHRLLARVPRTLRDRGRRQLVLLTTNYDDLIERALTEALLPPLARWRGRADRASEQVHRARAGGATRDSETARRDRPGRFQA
jgi:hypothetical protein